MRPPSVAQCVFFGGGGGCSALGCGVRAALTALLPAQGFDPGGAGTGGETGQGQGAEPHVFTRHDELPETFLVGEGITGTPRPPPAAPTAGATVLGLLLLTNQLGVTHLEMGGGNGGEETGGGNGEREWGEETG